MKRGCIHHRTTVKVLRDFVNETLAHERDRPEDSPPSVLLSTVHRVNSEAVVGDYQLQGSHHRRGPSRRYRRERESVYKALDQREILRLLIEHEYEGSKMRKTLYMVFSQLEAETQRATEAEIQIKAYIDRFQRLSAEKTTVERESHTLEEELTLYKIQYDLAQKEISKARGTVIALQSQVDTAEQVARKARGDARKVKEALEIWKAREEGRRQGFEAGWNRAREEFGAMNAQPVLEYENENRVPPEMTSFPYAHGSGDGEDTISYRTYPPPEHRTLIQFPEVPVVSAPIKDPPQSRPMPESTSGRSPDYELHNQHSTPTLSSSQQAPLKPLATPAVQMYSLPIPPADQVEFDNRIPSPARRQPRSQPQPRFAEPPIPRVPSPRPPDNFIPAASEDGHISLPPPHELAEYPPSPQPSVNALPGPPDYSSRKESLDEGPRREYTSSKGKARATDSWYNQRGEVDSRIHIPDATVTSVSQPESTSWYQARSPDDRTRLASISSRYSVNSSGGLLDAWGYPIQTEPKRSGGLGTTLKNIFRGKGKDTGKLSIIKENPLSRQGSFNVGPVPTSSFGAPRPSRGPTHSKFSVSNSSNQRLADELRYDDPDTANMERVQPHEDMSPSKDRPPRNVRIPAQLTVPALLSNHQRHNPNINRRGRTMSMSSAIPRFYESSHLPQTASRGARESRTGGDLRRPSSQNATHGTRDRPAQMAPISTHFVDPTSPPVSISVQPPSQSPSDAPNGLNSATRNGPGTPTERYLSPHKSPSLLPDHVRPRSTSLKLRNHRSSSGQPVNPYIQEDRPSLSQPHRGGSPGFSDRGNHDGSRTPNTQALYRDSSPFDMNSIRPQRPSRVLEALPNPHQRSASATSDRYFSSNHHFDREDREDGAPTSLRSPSLGSHKRFESLDIAPVSFVDGLPNSPLGHSSHEGGGGSLKRVTSNLSVRSAGSQYSHFDPQTYRDPAYFTLDTDPRH
ncbi:hypothetical protein J3R30DRAFT_1014037 [Lentinula aciculospora]|uniref:Uncharacterized protein n=1 Tax=Lentinula aciculospora TaxID=153920 RepID=A0A9W9A122_9AGAR|nr:hypothetical protein J3R30DRAFT_1014037 [Lentinula aciculospora]